MESVAHWLEQLLPELEINGSNSIHYFLEHCSSYQHKK